MKLLALSFAYLALAIIHATAAEPPRKCENTGPTCLDVCPSDEEGTFHQWCGSCEWYITCNRGTMEFLPCNDNTIWNDEVKLCTATSPVCRECIVDTPSPPTDVSVTTTTTTPPPAPAVCESTGPACISSCLGTMNGYYQWCGRCDYYLGCFGGTVSYMPCAPGTVWDQNKLGCDYFSDTCLQCETPCQILVQQHLNSSYHIRNFFYRTWEEYKVGFGEISSDYWIGNEELHRLTNGNKRYKLRFDLQSLPQELGLWYWAEYSTFIVSNESSGYQMQMEGFSGTVYSDAVNDPASGSLNGMKFTTKDRDNDMRPEANCADGIAGGFWYNSCGNCLVNSEDFVWAYLNDKGNYMLQTSRMWLLCA